MRYLFWLSLRRTRILHLSNKRSLDFWDRESGLDGGSSFDPVEPCLEAGELVKTFNAGKVVTPNPTAHP